MFHLSILDLRNKVDLSQRQSADSLQPAPTNRLKHYSFFFDLLKPCEYKHDVSPILSVYVLPFLRSWIPDVLTRPTLNVDPPARVSVVKNVTSDCVKCT